MSRSQGPTAEGITIWYRVDSKGWYADKLKRFTGQSVASMRDAVKIHSVLTRPAATLKLVVAGSDKTEIDLEDMQDLVDEGGVFNFKQLISDYDINEDSPILVKLLAGELTETQLLALVPPSITYIRSKPKATTYSSWARTPHFVQKWDNFIQNANGMAVDDTTPQFHKPNFRNFEVSKERYVQASLQINVLHVLSRTIGDRQPSKERFWRSSPLETIKGNPDFVLLAAGWNLFLLPIEVKTRWTLPDDNIVEILNTEESSSVGVKNSIRQIFGYMAHNKRRYGVLTTYEKTWFLQRPENDTGALLISDAVKCEDTSPTLLRCFAYIMSLARQNNSDCPFPPPLLPQALGDNYEPSGKRGQPLKGFSRKRNQHNSQGAPGNEQLNRGELRLEKFDWGSFEVADVLSEGRCGTVFEGTLRGERVVITLSDPWQRPKVREEILREARVYVELEKLQGHGIPKLKGVGWTAGGLFALMTEFGGSPIELKDLNDEKREMIVRVLGSIHGEGYLHGGLQPENILVEDRHDGPRITFIDFGFSKKFSNHKESEDEMAALKEMIGFCPIKRPRTYYLGG